MGSVIGGVQRDPYVFSVRGEFVEERMIHQSIMDCNGYSSASQAFIITPDQLETWQDKFVLFRLVSESSTTFILNLESIEMSSCLSRNRLACERIFNFLT